MNGKERIILPQKYYLDYFKEVLLFIRKNSGHLLDEVDYDFYETFNSLSEDAQCTLIRMANRKGEYFRIDKFKYDEIAKQGEAIEELIETEFITLDLPQDPHLFSYLTKKELLTLFPEHISKTMLKTEILLNLEEEATKQEYTTLFEKYTIVKIQIQEHIEFLKMLYFGNTHSMMTEFVIRDVGNIQLEDLNNHDFTPWFQTRSEALAVFELSKWNTAVKIAFETYLPEEVSAILTPVNWSNMINYPAAQKIADKLMLRLGEYFEKVGLLETAITYFELARKHPARERRVRILDKLNEVDAAMDLAKYILEQPYSAKEQIFARDYIAKKDNKSIRSTTVRINSSDSIMVIRNMGMRVESQALDHFASLGYEGIHAENFLWRNLFALTFWTELFDSKFSSFHHPLQRVPSDLYNEAFYTERKTDLNGRLEKIRTKKQLIGLIKKTSEQKKGINNPLIYWHENLFDSLERLVNYLPLKGLKKVLLEIAKNVKDNSTGFPDLFIWKGNNYFFYEIKSPNDHLSAQQLFWIDFLQKQKINADILRVVYQKEED